ncbi:MAG: nucleotidyltransferase family protein [Magnetospirillum sp.]|nr:nucleotidyltransferase family protein [Magnetospirillum sp.]
MGRARTLAEVIAILKEHESFFREKGITRLAVFGSVARGDARPDSDVDLVIDLDPEVKFSYIDLGIVEDASGDWLGRKTDMLTRRALRPLMANEVAKDGVDVFR